jgi:putative phage-type endonuclease
MHPRAKELISQSYADQRSEEWLALRGTMLTASDLASAIGDNPYEKPSDLLLKKCGAVKWGGNAATAHGTLLEPIARDLYDLRHDQKSHEIGLVQHPVHKWLGGSPDGVTESGRLIEIKCPLTRKITRAVPKYYLPQIQLLLEVLDLEVCDFIQYRPAKTIRECKECRACNLGVFVAGGCECEWFEYPDPDHPEEFEVTEVVRDRAWFARILPIAKAFWDQVLLRRQIGLCEVEDEDDESIPVIAAGLVKDYVCELESDDEVREMSEPSGSAGSDMSGVHEQVLHEVHPTGDAPVPEARRSERIRTRSAGKEAGQGGGAQSD